MPRARATTAISPTQSMPARLRPWCRHGTPSQRRASITTSSRVTASAGIGILHQRVDARHVGLTTEIDDVVEPADARVDALVATRIDAEGIAHGDGVPHRHEQLDAAGAGGPALDLDRPAGIGAGGPGEQAAIEPAIRRRAIDGGGEHRSIG